MDELGLQTVIRRAVVVACKRDESDSSNILVAFGKAEGVCAGREPSLA